MRTRSIAATLLLGLVVCCFLLQDASRAHGGAYRGPADALPAGGAAGDTVPGAAGSGGSGGGRSQGPSSGPSGTDTKAPTGQDSAPATPATPPTGAAVGGIDPLGWSVWWELNKDAYLDLKAHVLSHDIVPGSDRFFLGGWPVSMSRDSLRPTSEQVEKRVVPALLEALETETHNEIITGCLIALARTGRSIERVTATELRTAFSTFLADRSQEIAETAALSIGILGDDGGVPILRDLLLDTRSGRELVSGTEVDYRTRAFAAYGLALIGGRTRSEDVRAHVVSTLFRALHTDRTATKDVGVACVVAIGHVPIVAAFPAPPHAGHVGPRESWPPSSCRVAQLDSLLAFFEDDENDFLVRSHVPSAIASLLQGLPRSVGTPIGYRAAESFIARIAGTTSEPREVVQGCVMALGRMGDSDRDSIDVRIRKTLSGQNVSDLLARNLALIALAQIASRPGEGADAGSGRRAIEADLLRRLDGSTWERPWAGIALGVLGRADAASRTASPELERALIAALEEARVPSELAAYAVACGIAGIEDAMPLMHDRLEGLAVDDARGYVVLALGLLGRRDSAALVHGIASESRYRPELLRQAAVSLGLLGDKSAVPGLLEMMGAARGLSTQAATASALGFIGDSRSIDPLLGLLADDERYTDGARGFAAVALGLVCDEDPLPWNAAFSANLNYRASTPTLNDDRGAGLLNIL